MMSTTHCVSGVRHEGNPRGRFDTIGGVKCYLATPTVDHPKQKAVLFLPDVFGIELVNGQLLCDDFATNGLQVSTLSSYRHYPAHCPGYVVAVDLFNGDPAPVDAMEAGTFDFGAWILNHGPQVTRPRIDNVIAALKQQGIKELAVTGYCFSARYVFDLAFDHVVKVAAVAHPSFLKIPEDLHNFKQTQVPLLINSCEIDGMFPTDAQAQADAILGAGLTKTALYRREYFAGCSHGFAIRGDISNPQVKAGKEGAFKATVEFFLEHF